MMSKLNLSKTIYVMSYDKNKTFEVVLQELYNSYFVDVVVNSNRVYTYQISDPKQLLKEDIDLMEGLKIIFLEDKERWIDVRACSEIAEFINTIELVGRKSIITFEVNNIMFEIVITNIGGDTFKLTFTNHSNNDIMNCFVKGESEKEVEDKVSMYAAIIADFASRFHSETKDMIGNTFRLSMQNKDWLSK